MSMPDFSSLPRNLPPPVEGDLDAEIPKLLNFIGGEFVEAECGRWIQNLNPASNSLLSYVPRSGERDVEKAISAAEKAYRSGERERDWTVEKRVEFLKNVASTLEASLSPLALLESQDTGKPISLSLSLDIPRAISNFRFFAAMLETNDEQCTHMTGVINYTVRTPLGLVGLITPWNLPLYLLTWKLAPALAMGNAMVMKCSEWTPSTATELCRILHSCGCPPGMVNLVHGYGAEVGQTMLEHPSIHAISFTGGTATGKIVARTAAPLFKKVSLELGGSNAALVFKDCDMDRAVSECVRGGFANQGQVCLCLKRVLVEKCIYEEFKEKYCKAVEKLNEGIGNPQSPTTRFGSLISLPQRSLLEAYIARAKAEGGNLLVGGERPKMDAPYDEGAFLQCTVFDNLSPSTCTTCQEEIFGPLTVLVPFSSADDAINMANSTPYGLCASVFTQSLSLAHTVSAKLDVGMVWVNSWLIRDLRTPFGGQKASGVDREGGERSLHFFSEEKNVCIKL